MGKITLDNLAETIQQSLTEYGNNVLNVIDEVGDQVSKNTVKKLKQTSPKKTGKYAKSWKVSSYKMFGEAKKYRIHADKPHYRLTHLLEHGHMTRNGKRTKAIPHIAPVEREAIEEYKEKLERGISNVSN